MDARLTLALAIVLGASLASPGVLGTASTVSLVRVTPFVIHASPGEDVRIHATLTNTGAAADAFNVTFVWLDDGTLWYPDLAPAWDVLLAAGETVALELNVTPPAAGGTLGFWLRACSFTTPTDCQQVRWAVLTPLFATLTFLPDYRWDAPVNGTATIRWLDGSPANDTYVRLRHQSDATGLITSAQEGRTGPDGNATIVFQSRLANWPGGHHVYAEYPDTFNATTHAEARYNVTFP